MRAAFAHRAQRLRSTSLSTVPPPLHSPDYSNDYASIAASILYRSPLPSESGLPVYILNAAAFPDSFEVDYDSLLPYVLARLPGEEELLAGEDYEVVFFAGGQPESATSEKKNGPGLGWYLQAYHVLSRAVRKRLQRLYVVHERSWVRVLIEVFGTIVSPKFRKKIAHISNLSSLAQHMSIERLLIPPSVYLHDRRVSSDIYSPSIGAGRRAFSANEPLPRNLYGQRRLPRVLRESTSFICKGDNIKTEGLFRIPPHSILVAILKEAYDRGQQFIVWKEGSISYTQPGINSETMNEIHQADAYGVHLAAGLIKLWYRELRQPVFPESCYDEMRYIAGAADYQIELNDLAELLSPISSTSCLTQTARLILVLHLIPMLSFVTRHEPSNKMSSMNLAICFAPALVCGSDQLADAKMTSVIRRVLEAAIDYWPDGLSSAVRESPDSFAAALKPPSSRQEFEDPLSEDYPSATEDSQDEPHRIMLQDEDDDESIKPPLPPRPASSSKQTFPARSDSLAFSSKRKPTRSGGVPPRYSSLHAKSASDTSGSSTSYASAVETFAVDMKTALPPKQAPAAPRVAAPTPVVPLQTDLLNELKNSLATDIAKRKPVSLSASPISPGFPVEKEKDKATATQQRLASVRVPSEGFVRPAENNTATGIQQRSASVRVPSEGFARPAWPASARQSVSMVKSRTAPPVSTQAGLSAPSFAPRPRTPSPGLLKRMASMESMHSASQYDNLKVNNKIGLRKASVDDLKRLYEERANTTAKLADANNRRESNAT